MNTRIDHLVYAAPDLDEAVADLERRLGVRAAPGGRHPGRGTRNAIIGLGPACYLEIVAPDPDQPAPPGGRWLGVDALDGAARLTAWAAPSDDVPSLVARAAGAGARLGPAAAGSRRRPDGSTLAWTFTDPAVVLGDGVVPFFIDWGRGPHPAAGAPRGVSLHALRAVHPDPVGIRRILSVLAVDLEVSAGPRPALVATLGSAHALVNLS